MQRWRAELRNWQRMARGDLTDAITGATTLKVHAVHEVGWDVTDAVARALTRHLRPAAARVERAATTCRGEVVLAPGATNPRSFV